MKLINMIKATTDLAQLREEKIDNYKEAKSGQQG